MEEIALPDAAAVVVFQCLHHVASSLGCLFIWVSGVLSSTCRSSNARTGSKLSMTQNFFPSMLHTPKWSSGSIRVWDLATFEAFFNPPSPRHSLVPPASRVRSDVDENRCLFMGRYGLLKMVLSDFCGDMQPFKEPLEPDIMCSAHCRSLVSKPF